MTAYPRTWSNSGGGCKQTEGDTFALRYLAFVHSCGAALARLDQPFCWHDCSSQQCFSSRWLSTWSLMAVSQVKSLCNLGIKQLSALLRGCYVYNSVKMTNVSGFPVPAQSTTVFCWIFNVAYYLSKGQMFFLEIHVYCRYNTLNYDLYASSPKDSAKFNIVFLEPKGIFFLCQKRGFPFPTCTFLLVDFQ